MKKDCENCRWWSVQDPELVLFGDCRLNAPSIMLGSNSPRGVWPVTYGSDFCGEWEGKPDVEVG